MNNRSFASTGVFLAITGYLLLAAVAVQSAVVYKWRDAQGNLHFEDHPPVQGAEKVIVDDKHREDGAYREQMDKQLKLLRIYQEDRQESEQLKEKKQHDKELHQRNCHLAMKYLDNVRTARYLYEDTKDPRNPRILTDAERTAETARAETDVAHWCRTGS